MKNVGYFEAVAEEAVEGYVGRPDEGEGFSEVAALKVAGQKKD